MRDNIGHHNVNCIDYQFINNECSCIVAVFNSLHAFER